MTPTLHTIIREAIGCALLVPSLSGKTSHYDTIATDAEAAIRALMVSDDAVKRAANAYQKSLVATMDQAWGSALEFTDNAMRAALTAATGAT